MAVIETWFNQDLQKPVKTQYIDGSLFSNNGNGNRIGVVVTDNGEPVTISGTVSGYVVISNGSTVPCTGAKSGNRASILIPPAAYVPGSAFISLFVTDGTTVTTLAALSTTVLQTRTGTQVDPGSVVTDWTQTINGAMQDVQTAAANLGSIVATPYASLTYPVPLGKYTYYDGGLYRCISPIASSETFTPAHWTAVKLGDDVSDLKSAFSDISGSTRNLFNIGDLQIGKAWNLGDNSARAIVTIPVEPNTEYTLSWTIPNDFDGIYHVDKVAATDTTAISSGNATSSPKTFTTPATANFFVVQFSKTAISKSDFNGFEMQLEKGETATAYVDHYTAVDEILRDTAIKTYNTIANMKADMLIASGDRVQTMGYHSTGDGGEAKYLVRTIGGDTADDSTIIQLNNGLVAELIVENATINIKQLGAKPQDGEGRHDIASYLEIFETRLRNKAKLYIPMGIWNCSGYEITKPVHIYGDYAFTKATNGGLYSTVITPYQYSQDYIIKISSISNGIVPTFVLTDIIFSSAFFTLETTNYNYSSYSNLAEAIIVLEGAEFGTIDNIMFLYSNRTCLDFKGCCEILVKNLNIRIKDSVIRPTILFEKNTERAMNSSIIFETTQIEGVIGNVFEFRDYICNCDFGDIMFEQGMPVNCSNKKAVTGDQYDDLTVKRLGLIYVNSGAYILNVRFNSFNLDGFAAYSVMEGNNDYIYDCIITGDSSTPAFINISNIVISNISKKFYLISGGNSDEGTGRIGGSVSIIDFGRINYSGGSLVNDREIYPEMHARYVPKYSVSRRMDGKRYIFANELYYPSSFGDNLNISILGNKYDGVDVSKTLTPEHCAICNMKGVSANKTRILARIFYDTNIKKISFRTTSTPNAAAYIELLQNGQVKATINFTNTGTLADWEWHSIEAENLTGLVDGYVDIRFVVDGYGVGGLDCCLIE